MSDKDIKALETGLTRSVSPLIYYKLYENKLKNVKKISSVHRKQFYLPLQ